MTPRWRGRASCRIGWRERLDAGAFDPRRELAADLLGELGSDLVAEEGGDVFGPRFRKGRLLTVRMACRESCSERGLRMAGVRNTRSVAYSTCMKLQ